MVYKRPSVNIPIDLWPAVEKRIGECPYNSFSNYVIGLIVFDLWSRREHRITVPLMRKPPAIRDAVIAQLGADYLAGKRGREEPGWFEQYVNELAEQKAKELLSAPEKSPAT